MPQRSRSSSDGEMPDFGRLLNLMSSRRRRDSNHDDAEAYTPQIEIPHEFIHQCIWLCPSEPSALPGVVSSQSLSEIAGMFSLAFFASESFASDHVHPVFPPEMAITLYSPYPAGQEVIGQLIRRLAQQHKANTLVLDPRELALGKFGVLGERDGHIMDRVFDFRTKNEMQEDPRLSDVSHEDVRGLFISMISQALSGSYQPSDAAQPSATNFGAESSSSSSSSPVTAPPDNLVIYLPNFGSMAGSAESFIAALLSAIHIIKKSSAQPSRIILVFGVSSPLVLGSDKGNTSLGENDGFSTLRVRSTPLRRSDQSQSLPSMPKLNNHALVYNGMESLPLKRFLITQIFPFFQKGEDAEENCFHLSDHSHRQAQRLLRYAMKRPYIVKDLPPPKALDELLQIHNDTIVTALLGSKDAFCPFRHPSDAFVLDHSNIRRHDQILSPVVADIVTTAAIGYALAELGPSPPHPLPVTLVQMNRGYTQYLTGIQQSVPDNTSTVSIDGGINPDIVSSSQLADQLEARVAVIDRLRENSDLTKDERDLLSCIVDPRTLTTRLEDICVKQEVIDTLQSVTTLRILNPKYYASGILHSEAVPGVLLCGPPGTGKTMICRALARECHTQMVVIKPSNVYDCRVGNSEKKVAAVFSLASRIAPCVIFIDEIDGIFSDRKSSSGSPWRTDLLTEFLQTMEGFDSMRTNNGVIVVAATNRPMDLEDAILRRFPYRIMFELPDPTQREKIIKNLLSQDSLDLTNDDIASIVSKTNKYSGSDLKNLCVAAAQHAVQDSVKGVPNKSENPAPTAKSAKGKSTPNSSSSSTTAKRPTVHILGGKDMNRSGYSAKATITMAHFERALVQVRPSISPSGLAELLSWHRRQSGLSGGDRIGHFSLIRLKLRKWLGQNLVRIGKKYLVN
ncbi:hypothetical protein C8J56DRAFT_859765 [Mycena floridula]|nr:hypothetical protein C8J56DRAFT_859765 [Mycena floridula]